jgi:hypothetical protein
MIGSPDERYENTMEFQLPLFEPEDIPPTLPEAVEEPLCDEATAKPLPPKPLYTLEKRTERPPNHSAKPDALYMLTIYTPMFLKLRL